MVPISRKLSVLICAAFASALMLKTAYGADGEQPLPSPGFQILMQHSDPGRAVRPFRSPYNGEVIDVLDRKSTRLNSSH